MVRRPQGGVTSPPGSRGGDAGDSERGLTGGRFDQVNLGGEGHWATQMDRRPRLCRTVGVQLRGRRGARGERVREAWLDCVPRRESWKICK